MVALWDIADTAHLARAATLHAPVPPEAPANSTPDAALAFSADGRTLAGPRATGDNVALSALP
jgi:hypothetical protein